MNVVSFFALFMLRRLNVSHYEQIFIYLARWKAIINYTT